MSQKQKPDQRAAPSTYAEERFVYVRYRDHVLYHRTNPGIVKPQIREAVGWLVYNCANYIVLCWDRSADPPTLKGGDPNASGLVIVHSDIIELQELRGLC